MSFERLLGDGSLRRHRTSREEIAELLATAARDLADAGVVGLSTDRRFILLYEAALSYSTIALAAEGYRTVSSGHHVTVLTSIPMVLGEELGQLADYLLLCRRLRHEALYERVAVVVQSEADELAEAVVALRDRVLAWLTQQHPELLPEESGG